VEDTTSNNLNNLTSTEKIKGVSKIKKGFRFIWTAVTLTDDCDQFQCEGGDFCIDENKMLCQPTNRYCISKSLVCDGVLNCDLGDHSDEKQCELNFIKSQKFILTLGSCILVCLFLLLICISIQKIKSRRLKLNYSDEYVLKEKSLDQPDYAIGVGKNLKIEKKLNKLSSFTLQSSTFIEDDFNEEEKGIKQSKMEKKTSEAKRNSSTSSSSSLSLVNKSPSDHYQIETVIPKQNHLHMSSYRPFVNVINNSNLNKRTFLNNENSSILFSDLPNEGDKTDILPPPISPVGSDDKKRGLSTNFGSSQITNDISMQSQTKQHGNSKNSSYFTDDGLSSFRRNSYTKAIFFDNL
jgi:hypothetical protein